MLLLQRVQLLANHIPAEDRDDPYIENNNSFTLALFLSCRTDFIHELPKWDLSFTANFLSTAVQKKKKKKKKKGQTYFTTS